MLKIKDNVDLKELEKFGFKQNKFNYYDDEIYICKDRKIILGIERNYDELDIIAGSTCIEITNELLTKLYDLIQAGLVEKVKE